MRDHVGIAAAFLIRAVVYFRFVIARNGHDDRRALNGQHARSRSDDILLRDILVIRVAHREDRVLNAARVTTDGGAVRRHIVLYDQHMAVFQARHRVGIRRYRLAGAGHAGDVPALQLVAGKVFGAVIDHN